jgi:hypothetical protein
MTSKQREPALPQMKEMLGRAAANRIAREGALARRPHRGRVRRAPIRTRLLATFAVAGAAAVVAVSAGAFDRSPVAPQLGPAQSGVKSDVVPGESMILHGPKGEVIHGAVSPCIKSDPSGYSDAELAEPEWCFHRPGAGKAGGETGAPPTQSSNGARAGEGGVVAKVYHLPSGEVRVQHLPGK